MFDRLCEGTLEAMRTQSVDIERIVMKRAMDIRDSWGWRERVIGLESTHPLLDGRLVRYINLDNAASTTALRAATRLMAVSGPFRG